MRYSAPAVILVLLLVMLVGCDSQQEPRPYTNPYEEIAAKHSEGLEHIKGRIVAASKAGHVITTENYREFARTAFVDYADASGLTAEQVEDAETVIYSLETVGPRSTLGEYIDDDVAISYIMQMTYLFYQNLHPDDFDQRVIGIEQQAWNTIGEDRAQLVLGAGAVGRDSYRYWYYNGDSWGSALGGGGGLGAGKAADCEVDWKGTGMYDLVGGAAGGVAGGIAYALRIGSRAGGVATMIAGAVGASAIKAFADYYECQK